MDNRVYYGEYSLKHWIELILSKNIILPEYQRYFVWDQDDVNKLIDTFKNKLFVPPVTIGAFKIENQSQNMILDGQQRLTSILLAFLGLYPDKSEYKKSYERFVNENDDEDDDEQMDNVFEWKFDLLTEKGRSKQEILSKVVKGNYKVINCNIDDKMLDTTFLGFSYLVPYISDKNQQQKYYSSVFRNINNQGKSLFPQESRQSLYFLDSDLKLFFDPKFLKAFSIKNFSTTVKIDFVRYLSLLSQYHKDKIANYLARGFKPQMEKYYEDYIYSVITDTDIKYGKFTDIFPGKEYSERFQNLENTLNSLEIPKQFLSIIDLDMYLFGLIYSIIFENKEIDNSNEDKLKADIENKISELKKNNSHVKAPSNLGHLRFRISSSIAIYEKYAT